MGAQHFVIAVGADAEAQACTTDGIEVCDFQIFLSRDPVMGLNRYGYTDGDPINRIATGTL